LEKLPVGILYNIINYITPNYRILKDSLISSSGDSTAKQWNITNGQIIQIFLGLVRFSLFISVGHTDSVASISVLEDFLFSGGYDSSVIQWIPCNWRPYANIYHMFFTYYYAPICTVVAVKDHVFSSHFSGDLIQWRFGEY
jgi:WD40 repeat protein